MKLIQGDCLEQMSKMESNSIDTIITDPPYGTFFMGKKWDYDVPSEAIWKEALRVLKPGGTALIFAGSRTQHRMAVRVEDAGFILKDTIMWLYGNGFPKATDISKQIDKKMGIKHPKNVPISNNGSMSGSNYTRNKMDVQSKEAKFWDGWKSHGLKPSYEPIIVAVKPNDGTYANNALKWGVSGLNIDGGRIETDEILNAEYEQPSGSGTYNWNTKKGKTEKTGRVNTKGRFPANIILDEEAGKMLNEQSGILKSGKAIRHKTGGSTFGGNNLKPPMENLVYEDKGGASRFFYCAKASKSERNAGCENLEEKQQWSKGGSGTGISDRGNIFNKNHHPMVKPLKLMEYLCILTKTPTGGTVFDPFMGSGTTGMACKNTNRDFIGIELNPEYIKIAEARINNQ